MDSEERDEHPREQRGWPFRKEEGHEYGCARARLCVFLLQLAAAKETGGGTGVCCDQKWSKLLRGESEGRGRFARDWQTAAGVCKVI